jgi:hypothetical protein
LEGGVVEGSHQRTPGGDGREPAEGLVAYAERQSRIQLDLRRRFSTNWRYVPEYIQDGWDSLGTIPADTAVESRAEDDGQEEVDPDDPVPEVARDVEVVASFVEEYLA